VTAVLFWTSARCRPGDRSHGSRAAVRPL